jgi:hypothetical protein
MSKTENPAAQTPIQLPSSTSSLIDMAVTGEPDFEAEYEKIKQNLTFFQDAITKKKQLDDIKQQIEQHKQELEVLEEERITVRLATKQSHETRLCMLADFDSKARKWLEGSMNSKDVMLSEIQQDVIVGYSKDLHKNRQEVEGKIKLAKENVELLQQQVQLYECTIEWSNLMTQLTELGDRVRSEKVVVDELEKEQRMLRIAHRVAVEQWKTKYQAQAQNISNSLDILQLNCNIKEKDLKIDDLENQLTSLWKTANAKDKTISSLRKQIADMQPIHDVSMDILNRRQELQRPKSCRNYGIIELGNKAAHYGSALADAQRISKIEGVQAGMELTWYEKDYGFRPEFVLNVGEHVPKFVEILDWHAAVKHFQPSAFSIFEKGKDDNALRFVSTFAHFKKAVISTYTGPRSLETFVNGIGFGGEKRELLQRCYQRAYREHKEKRAGQYYY